MSPPPKGSLINFMEVTYFVFNSYGCSLLPVHNSDDSEIFAIYIYSFENINYFLVFYAIKCFVVINKAYVKVCLIENNKLCKVQNPKDCLTKAAAKEEESTLR